MRIATSTIYGNQSASIDNLEATYQQQGQELSTGKSLNAPSDNPQVIAQDLAVRNDSAVATQIGSNLTGLNNELTTVDSALSNLNSIMQSARALAVQGASTTLTASQQQEMSQQVNQLLQEAVGVANTQYAGKYVFAGTAVATGGPLVQTNGNPITSVTSQANVAAQTQQLPSGQQVTAGVTLQQAFNVGSPDGSPDVFQTLIALRDTLANGSVVDKSQQQVNVSGTAIAATTTLANLTGTPPMLATPLTLDNSAGPPPGQASINISSGKSPSGGVTVTFTQGDTMSSFIAKINAQTSVTGVSASFDYKTQRLVLDGGSSNFQVSDVPSAGATTSGNLVESFGLVNQANVVSNLSTQLGDIDRATSAAINTRSVVGSTIQTAQALSSSASTQVNEDTQVQSSLEDTDIAKVVAQFSQTQTALQAAYSTTSRLEQKSLLDYI